MSLPWEQLTNPVYSKPFRVRDPSIFHRNGSYYLFYTKRVEDDPTQSPAHWKIGCARTKNFLQFEELDDVSADGFASPGDLIEWHGRLILPYQTYPAEPCRLVFIEVLFTDDGRIERRSSERTFLEEAAVLPWNGRGRLIDPSFVKNGDTLHAFFTGSVQIDGGCGHANLLGHAVTQDAGLERWDIVSKERPLIGRMEAATDGVENVAVFHNGERWIMIYSEGLVEQRLGLAVSDELYDWRLQGTLSIPGQTWMSDKYGAPFVWRETDRWVMLLMGDAAGYTTFGLLTSVDGLQWEPLEERSRR